MKSIFDPETYQEIKDRLQNIDENSQRQWGKMSPGQTMFHCQGPLNIMLEKVDYGFKPNWLAQILFKKALYNDKPWRKNLPTAKPFKNFGEKDLKTEKQKLIELIDELYSHREKEEWNPHPGFGYFTKQQWGQMQYKHLDHHLRQFDL